MWTGPAGDRRLVAVNYAGNQSQCYVRLPAAGPGVVRFRDVMGTLAFDRDGRDLDARGLYLDLPPWGHHVFDVSQGLRHRNDPLDQVVAGHAAPGSS
jgi:hypothetical protein